MIMSVESLVPGEVTSLRGELLLCINCLLLILITLQEDDLYQLLQCNHMYSPLLMLLLKCIIEIIYLYKFYAIIILYSYFADEKTLLF